MPIDDWVEVALGAVLTAAIFLFVVASGIFAANHPASVRSPAICSSAPFGQPAFFIPCNDIHPIRGA